MAPRLTLTGAELVDSAAPTIHLIFAAPDGTEWRVPVKSLPATAPAPPPAQGMDDTPPDRPVRQPGQWYAPPKPA